MEIVAKILRFGASVLARFCLRRVLVLFVRCLCMVRIYTGHVKVNIARVSTSLSHARAGQLTLHWVKMHKTPARRQTQKEMAADNHF